MSLNQLDQGFGKTTLFAGRSLTSTGDDEPSSSESSHLSLIALLLRGLGDDFHKECKLRRTCGVRAAPCVPCSVISQGTLLLLPSSCNRILQSLFSWVVGVYTAAPLFDWRPKK
ncbi:uncharacterized protein LOC144718777 [Lampetra planeri]